MDQERSILFGALALRAGLLDVDQLSTACDRWAGQRNRPLAELLVLPGGLSTEDRQHVDYLLERHLQRHGSAPAALAALADGTVRSALAGVRDPDLRDWLANLLPGGLWLDADARTRRTWALWVALGIGLAVLLIVGIGGGLFVGVVMTGERARMMEAQARAAEMQARSQLERAEANLQHDRDTLNLLLESLPGASDDPAKEQLRRDVLEKMLTKHRARIAQNSNDLNARQGAAEVYQQLGDLDLRAGRKREAESAYREALKQFAELQGRQPGVIRRQRDLARCQVRLAAVLREAEMTKEAEELLRAVIGQTQHLKDIDAPANRPQHEFELAEAYLQLARILHETGRKPEAAQTYAQARSLLQPLDRFPEKPEYRLELARCLLGIAALQQANMQPAPAEQTLRGAVGYLEQLVAAKQTEPSYRKELAAGYEALARLLQITGREKEADEMTQKAKALLEKKP